VDRLLIDDAVREQIMALTTDFPRVWNDPHTTDHDRKRLLRLLVEDVTLIKTHAITIHVRFRGGATQTLTVPAVRRSWETWKTTPEVIQTIDALLDTYTDQQIAAILQPGKGGAFQSHIVAKLRRSYGLKSRYERLREAGMLTAEEVAQALSISARTVKVWHTAGLLRGYAYNDKNCCLFEPPGPDAPLKHQGCRLADRRQLAEVVSESAKEVRMKHNLWLAARPRGSCAVASHNAPTFADSPGCSPAPDHSRLTLQCPADRWPRYCYQFDGTWVHGPVSLTCSANPNAAPAATRTAPRAPIPSSSRAGHSESASARTARLACSLPTRSTTSHPSVTLLQADAPAPTPPPARSATPANSPPAVERCVTALPYTARANLTQSLFGIRTVSVSYPRLNLLLPTVSTLLSRPTDTPPRALQRRNADHSRRP